MIEQQRGWPCKRTLVATTDKQVFTSAESRDQQARWLQLADTALHNRPCEKEMNPGTRAREQYQRVNREIEQTLKKVAGNPCLKKSCHLHAHCQSPDCNFEGTC